MESPDPRSAPRSDRPGGGVPDPDAMAVDALPDEVRLHGDGDETEQNQTTTGGPDPDPGEGDDADGR
jgi:hypothetical protein